VNASATYDVSGQAAFMDLIDSVAITIRRAILERFSPEPEREPWLAGLKARCCPGSHAGRYASSFRVAQV
jgi:hypothetical protein